MTTVLAAPESAGRADVDFGTKAVAFVACVAVGMRLDLVKGITPGLVVMVLLAPLWWPQVRSSRVVAWLVGLTAATVVSGFVLAWSVANQREVDWRTGSSSAILLALAFAGPVVLLWARTVISVGTVVAALEVGVLLFELSTPKNFTENPWKFALAAPVSVLALVAVAWWARRTGRRQLLLGAVVLLALAGIGVVSDFRSGASFLVLTLVLVSWQAVAVTGRRRLRALSPALLLVTVAGAVYLGATQLFVSGALGTAIQERSTQQIDASGSLLLGGRPEWSATVELMGARPSGYGFGVLADSTDVQLAENGFSSINADPATGYQGYITQYMLSNGFHLHSVAADLWSVTGVVGLLLAAFVVVMVIWGLSSSLAVGCADALMVFAAITLLWDIAFSPLNSAVPDIVLGLFLAVVGLQYARSHRRGPPSPPAPDTSPPTPSHRGAAGRVLYRAGATAPGTNGGPRGTR